MKSEIKVEDSNDKSGQTVSNIIVNTQKTIASDATILSINGKNDNLYHARSDEEVDPAHGENRLQIHHQKLVDGLSSQFRKQSYCDVVLKIGSTRIFVHSCVLSIFSPYFANILNIEESKSQRFKNETDKSYEESEQSNDRLWSSRNPLVINIDSFQANVESTRFEQLVLGLVHFLYSGELSLTEENVEDYKNLAANFECELLFSEINNFKETIYNQTSFIYVPDNYNVKEELKLTDPPHKSNNEKQTQAPIKRKHRKSSSDTTKIPNDASKKQKNAKLCVEKPKIDEQKSGNCCVRCGLMFSSPKELKEHRRAHFTKSFVCVTCGDAYYHIMEMLKHLDDWKHGETKCSVCGHDSKSQSNLIKHLDKHREPGKPYYCTECDQRFKCKRDLTMHIPKHSKTASFVCHVCEKGFKWKHALVAHMVTHSAEQKFLCSDCGFSTKHQTSFAAHQRQHNGKTYTCSVQGCGFQTIRKQNLKQHAKTHTKEKPHQCEICGQAFSLAKNMKRHSQLHDLTAMPESCPALEAKGCMFKSFRKDKMMTHVSRNHPWLEEQANETDGDRQKRILEDVAFAKAMSMVNPPNTIVTQSLATLPVSPPLVSASDILGGSCTTSLANSSISSAEVMMPSGTIHYP